MSIFDLKQSASELPSLNQGTSKLTYQQVPCTRDVTGTNFPNGSQHYRWETSGVRWWIPNRSYIRMRLRYFKADGTTQPVIGDDIAPNMGLVASMYQQAEFRMADKTISRVDNYMAQVDAITKRLSKSKAWLDSVGSDLEWWEPEFKNRQAKICTDGKVSDEKYEYSALVPTETPTQVGFDPVNTMQITAATRLVTFAAGGGAAVDIINTSPLHVGDRINTDAAGNYGNEIYEITRIIDATTANVERVDGAIADIAADVITNFTFTRIENQSPGRNGIESIWQPPLSIFGVPHAMPSGKYELILTPQTQAVYQKRAIESVVADQNAGVGNDFQVVVDDIYLYLATVEGPAVDNLSYFMSLEETRLQTEAIDGNGTSLQQKTFDVSPAAYALTIAFQDQNLQDTRNSASKFKFAAPVGGEVPSGELGLNRFYVQYNGENKPQPDADPAYNSPDNFLSSRYAESLLYSGAYFDCGGAESQDDWRERGLYMYYSYPKDGSSESTRVNVNYQFANNIPNGTANVLLFDHHKKMVLVSIVNGRIVDTIEQDG